MVFHKLTSCSSSRVGNNIVNSALEMVALYCAVTVKVFLASIYMVPEFAVLVNKPLYFSPVCRPDTDPIIP